MTNLINTLFYGVNGTFVWSEHLGKVILTALLSMVPTFEGRYALVGAQAMGMPAIPAYLIALVFSTLPMPFIFLLLRPILDLMYRLPIGFIQKFAAWVDRHAANKAGGVNKKGLLGLYLFVALPVPGTGVWTGTAIATVLKMDRRRAALMIVLGNITACLITTLITYLGVRIFS